MDYKKLKLTDTLKTELKKIINSNEIDSKELLEVLLSDKYYMDVFENQYNELTDKYFFIKSFLPNFNELKNKFIHQQKKD